VTYLAKDKKLIWILIEQPVNPNLLYSIKEAITKDLKTIEEYNFIITPSNLRPISLKTLKKYLEALLQQVKDLEAS